KMSRNGSGTYSLPAGNPVTTGTTISSTTHNNTMADVASAITESIARDGQTTPTANLPMGGFKHTNVADATARTDYGKVSQIQDGGYMMLSAVAGADTITASITPSITAYASGQFFTFIAAGANTGAVTLNINSIGAKAVTKEGTTALAAGDIASGAVVNVVYDGTRFQIVSGRSVQPLDAQLTTLAGITAQQATDLASVSTFIGTLLNDADAATARTTLGVDVAAVQGTAVASTSGTAIDYTGIPSTAKEITVMFAGVSTNGTSGFLIQIGDSGGIETNGYLSNTSYVENAAATIAVSATSGFLVRNGLATNVVHGTLVLSLIDAATNTWVASGTFANSAALVTIQSGGSKSLSATLTQVRITTVSGTDTFDAGLVNVRYK
ncbi:MAG TPA: hypothetical protein VIY48_21405, partial [Candidatus Paceibacterota bacterium]